MTTATPEAGGIPRVQGSKVYWAISDSMVISGRYLKHIVRQPEEIFMAIMIPAMMLLLFRYMLGGAVDAGNTTYANFLMPGILVIGVSLTAVSTTVSVFMDMQEGFVDRFRSMSMLGGSVVFGHVVAAMARAVIGFVALIGIGFAIGFRSSGDVLQWLAAFGVLVVFAFAVGWIAGLLGQIAKSTEGASGLAMLVVFAPYASNVFAPTETISGALGTFVEYQPVTHVIDTVRALLLDQPVGNSAWLALLWWGGIAAVAIPLSSRLFRRRFA
ncbi:ABC transporter permease [Streptomyces tendae]|uniref:ABC transporter permease n=1 Tax=Streptomyces tendae TaxID=1932 RepID=UPI0036C8C74F